MKQPELTQQILRLYIGRPCDIITSQESYSEYTNEGHIQKIGRKGVKVVLHLRRLESITEEDCKGLFMVLAGRNWALDTHEYTCKEKWWNAHSIMNGMVLSKDECIGIPSAWLFLLSRGFDLFGLIDAGLAKEVSE
jgi:hypothetical protein